MSMTTASADYFEHVAGEWDRLRSGYFTESLREAALAHAYLRPEMVVADVGSGTGFMAAGLAPLVQQVYAIDGSAAMLEVAQTNLAAFTNITFHRADGGNLPLDDGSIDAVFANMYLHHCKDPEAAIREMVRVLRPGGRLVITDMAKHEHEWMRQEMADEWLGFERSDIKAWLREAGLVNVIVDSGSQSCCATSQTTGREQACISVFVAAGSTQVAGARAAVQANYAAVATGEARSAEDEGSSCGCSASASSCCGAPNAMEQVPAGSSADFVLWDTGYTPEQLADVPVEAASISLGCGNPSALASLRPGEVVLDIGSGGGIDAFYAARRVGPTGKVMGLDMTPAMIERARQTAGRAGLAQVEFRLGQAEAMPVESDTVDVIMSNCVINLCEDKGKVFEEAYRVLRAGGRLSISDMVSDKPFPISWRGDASRWAGCINGALPEHEYLELVKAAGFTDIVATRSLSGGVIDGIHTYSLSLTARKHGSEGPGRAEYQVRGALPEGAITLTPSAGGPKGCCG